MGPKVCTCIFPNFDGKILSLTEKISKFNNLSFNIQCRYCIKMKLMLFMNPGEKFQFGAIGL